MKNRKRNINGKTYIAKTTVLADSSIKVEIFKDGKVVFMNNYKCSEESAITLAYSQYNQQFL